MANKMNEQSTIMRRSNDRDPRNRPSVYKNQLHSIESLEPASSQVRSQETIPINHVRSNRDGFVSIVLRPINTDSSSSMGTDTYQNSATEIEYKVSPQLLSIISATSTNGSRDQEPRIINLYGRAEEANRMLVTSKAVHFVITSTVPDEQTTYNTLFSNFLCSALDNTNPRSSIASQTVPDMFLVLKKAS